MTGTDVDETIGTLIAERFRIGSLLGRGGMASVYLADDESLGRTVAIKVFRQGSADGDELQRQQDEVQMLAGLNHPCLVTLFDASTDGSGNIFLVMELVDGIDLGTRLREGHLDQADVALVGINLAEALTYVHAKGIIHRDIKPANILLPKRDDDHTGPQAKLADFGIARIIDGSRLTATGQVLGTASYFSPEQALGEPMTPASDIYSLGLVLLESLTGVRAFPGTAVESMTARLARDPEVPAELGDSWVGLLKGMTTRDPDARPTARDVCGVLARLSTSNPPTLNPPTLAYPAAQPGAETGAITEQLGRSMPVSPPRASGPAKPARPANPPKPARQPEPARQRRSLPWRRILQVVVALAAALLLVWLISFAINSFSPGSEMEPPPDYPAVEGPLGTHLEQLERSVEP